MSNNTYNTAIVNQSAPYGSAKGLESLDMALALSNFGQTVSLFFVDDGVWQLVNQQTPENINAKAYFKTFAALEFYDIENVYVCENSLQQRNLTTKQLCVPCQLLKPKALTNTLSQHNQVMVF